MVYVQKLIIISVTGENEKVDAEKSAINLSQGYCIIILQEPIK